MDVYAASDGLPTGSGTRDDPVDLATALANESLVVPGTTVWIAGGTYQGPFDKPPTPAGTEANPIVYRAMPGERVTLTANADNVPTVLKTRADYVWFWGLEITSPSSSPPAMARGVWMAGGDGCRLINLLVHDNPGRDGMTSFATGNGQEIYGCLVYRNGGPTPGERHHGIYTDNTSDYSTKTFEDLLIFDNLDHGLHCFGTTRIIDGYRIEGVASWGNGVSTIVNPNILIGTTSGYTLNIDVRECYTYYPAVDSSHIGAQLGFTDNSDNINLSVRDCVFAGGNHAAEVSRWRSAIFTNNTLYSRKPLPGGNWAVLSVRSPRSGHDLRLSTVDHNRYFSKHDGAHIWRYEKKNREALFFEDIESWRAYTGWDKNSEVSFGDPPEPMMFLRPNRYEGNRAHLIVYNWPKTSSLSLDFGRLWDLQDGDRYSVYSAEDVWGAPVFESSYEGTPVDFPMEGSYAPEFAAYIISKEAKQNPKRCCRLLVTLKKSPLSRS